MEVLTPKSLKEYFITKLNACREYSSLKYEYVNIRRVWNFAFDMMNDSPKIDLFTGKLQMEVKKLKISKDVVFKAISTLRGEGDFENCLMLSLISKYQLLPGILVLIRFEDFGTGKDSKRFLNVFERRRMRYSMIYVDEETFGAVLGLKQTRLNRKRRQYETKRGCGKGCYVHGYFIFPAQRCSIGGRLQNGFNGRIPEFKSSTQEVISICKASE